VQVLRAASSFTALRSLTVGLFWLPAPGTSQRHNVTFCESFIGALQSLTQLTLLDISSKKVNPYHAKRKTPEHMHAASILIAGAAHRLAAVLPAMSNLLDLRLCADLSKYTRDFECQELLESLQRCPSLQHLTLRGLSIATDDAVSAEHKTLLRTNRGDEHNTHDEGGQRFAHSLRAISLGGGADVVKGRWAFGVALVRMTALKSLALTCRELYEPALLPLKQVLAGSSARPLQHLTKLSLSGSNFGNESSSDTTSLLLTCTMSATWLLSSSG
jgi:hypothetical protein